DRGRAADLCGRLRAELLQPGAPCGRCADRRPGARGYPLRALLSSRRLQPALAWLLRRSPNILLIPGTSSQVHLRENLAAAALDLPQDAVTALDAVAA